MPEKASNVASHGFLVCCGITILIINKVLLDVMFKGFKAMLLSWCGSAGNNRVVVCSSVSVVIHKVIGRLWMVLLVWIILWMELWMVGK